MLHQIEVTYVDENYAWALCDNPVEREFSTIEEATKFAKNIGGIQNGNFVTKSCGNTLKFDMTDATSVCPACGTPWVIPVSGDEFAIFEDTSIED